jgi:hypothetical protein
MLRKGIRAGANALGKGLFRKYEHQLKEEEAEADLLRQQHLANYQDSLLTNRAKVLKEHEIDVTYKQKRKEALGASDLADEITLKDAGKLHDSLAEREGIENLPSKEEFKSDMLFISRATKGATPLNNDQKIEIIKNANEAWDKLSTLGGEEYDMWIAKYGPSKARSKFIESQINSSIFGGSSAVDKAEKSVGKAKQKKIIKGLKEMEPEKAIMKIMDKEKIDRQEAIGKWEKLTGKRFLQPDKSKKRPSFLRQSFPGLLTGDEKENKSIFDM